MKLTMTTDDGKQVHVSPTRDGKIVLMIGSGTIRLELSEAVALGGLLEAGVDALPDVGEDDEDG